MKIDLGNKKTYHLNFQKLLGLLLVFGILTVTGFIIYKLVAPRSGYISFGILNSEMNADNYPTEISVGENLSIYIFVENHLNRDLNFRVEILRGNVSTILSSNGSVNASSYLNITSQVKNGFNWISNMVNVSFSNPGISRILIVELWEISEDMKQTFHDILWLRLNVTL